MELFLAVVREGDVKKEEVSERWIVAGFKNGGRGLQSWNKQGNRVYGEPPEVPALPTSWFQSVRLVSDF